MIFHVPRTRLVKLIQTFSLKIWFILKENMKVYKTKQQINVSTVQYV